MPFVETISRWFGREQPRDRETRSGVEWATTSSTEDSPAHRGRNEDSFFVDGRRGVIGVADGVSGGSKGQGGEQASRTAVEALRAWTDAAENADRSAAEVQRSLIKMLQSAADGLHAALEEKRKRVDADRPQTTMIVAKTVEDREGNVSAVVARVGNSRAYVWREDGRLERVRFELPKQAGGKRIAHEGFEVPILNREMTAREAELADQATSVEQLAERWTHAQVLDGKMKPDEADAFLRAGDFTRVPRLRRTPETANLGARAGRDTDVETSVVTGLRPGDRVLLFSDGISDTLPDMDMRDILNASGSMQDGVDALRRESQRRMLANARGGKPFPRAAADDTTGIGIEVPGGKPRESKVTPKSSVEAVVDVRKPVEELRGDAKWYPDRTEEINRQLRLIEADAAALESKVRVEEIEQIIRHEGASDYWKRRLDVRSRELTARMREANEIRALAKKEREVAQRKIDEAQMRAVRERLDI